MVAELSYSLVEPGTWACSADGPPGVWLSVLIPAYEHPTGVLRILDRLHAVKVAGVECLISDDSRSDAVDAAVSSHPLYRAGGVVYRRNRPALGAVPNWNNLLARARGEYLLLMHHDECPERDDFFAVLKDQLAISDAPDVLFLACLLPTLGGRRLRHHVPIWLRRVLMQLGPEHLLRHNTLGPPSVVVVRRNICAGFDPALKWLVDVEWMVRLLRQTGVRWDFAKQLAVVSLPHAATSITASLGGDISRLCDEESRLIQERLGSSPVFCLLLPDTTAKRLLARVERGLWLIVRVLTRSTGWLSGRPRPAWLPREA